MANASATQAKPSAIVEVERLGFGWSEVAQYDLTRLDVSRRVQVREVGHYAQKDIVEQFAIQMGESQFPPIVVTNDDWIVDGNTRVGAALRRKAKFFPALVLDVRWGGASSKQQSELRMLAATLNAQGGVRLTAKETREVAGYGISLGWKAEQIGRAIGLAAAGVTAIKKEIEAATKLKRVGLDLNGDRSIKSASLRALGAKDVLALNDVPFRDLARLAGDAGLNAGEIASLAKEARQTGSDAGAVTLLTSQRTEMGDRIRERELTGVGKPPMSRQLRQHLGFVTKYAGKEHELLETDPKVFATHTEALTNAIAVLSAVLEMQR